MNVYVVVENYEGIATVVQKGFMTEDEASKKREELILQLFATMQKYDEYVKNGGIKFIWEVFEVEIGPPKDCAWKNSPKVISFMKALKRHSSVVVGGINESFEESETFTGFKLHALSTLVDLNQEAGDMIRAVRELEV